MTSRLPLVFYRQCCLLDFLLYPGRVSNMHQYSKSIIIKHSLYIRHGLYLGGISRSHATKLIMKTQVVSDRIFPPNRRIMVAFIFEKWNIGDYPVVNFSQCHLSGWGAFECHRYQISIATVTPGIFSEIWRWIYWQMNEI